VVSDGGADWREIARQRGLEVERLTQENVRLQQRLEASWDREDQQAQARITLWVLERWVKAAREILAEHVFAGTPPLAAHDECRACVAPWPCPTVRALASVYGDGEEAG
jgi:hypothetical protein